MNTRLPCILVCWIFSILSTNVAAETWQEPQYLLQAFEQVALRNEYQNAPQTVRKWQQPIKVWLAHHTAQAITDSQKQSQQQLAWLHLQHLSKLTGVSMLPANQPNEANLTLVFSLMQSWHQEVVQISGNPSTKPPSDAVCMFGVSLDAKKAIKRAWVVIPVDHAQEHRALLSCIVEELTQAMGLPNDSDQVYPSVFNDQTPETLLTGLDGLLLKMLYHPKLKVGMTAQQARPILQEILQQWQEDGTLEQAEKNVRQSELYEMMGF